MLVFIDRRHNDSFHIRAYYIKFNILLLFSCFGMTKKNQKRLRERTNFYYDESHLYLGQCEFLLSDKVFTIGAGCSDTGEQT